MRLSDTIIRDVLLAEMANAKLSRHALQAKTKMPMSTIYQVFNTKRGVRLAFEAVCLIVEALGRNLAWLEKQGLKVAGVAKKPAPKKAPAKPKKKR